MNAQLCFAACQTTIEFAGEGIVILVFIIANLAIPADNLIETIRRVHQGEAFVQPEIASRMLRELLSPQATPIEPLTEREREVLVLLAQGDSNREIAERLVVAEGTVKNHVSNILGKLQAENRTQAADIARRYGLV